MAADAMKEFHDWCASVGIAPTAIRLHAWQAETLAERERCALAIDSFPHWIGSQAKMEIANKIRSGE